MRQFSEKKFIEKIQANMTNRLNRIDDCEKYEDCERITRSILSYVDCLVDLKESMAEQEKAFVRVFDRLIKQWRCNAYNALLGKAESMGQSEDIIQASRRRCNENRR